jgi:hypothetical protein
MLPNPNQAPAWVLPGAYLDLDFRNRRFWGGSWGWRTGTGELFSLQNLGASNAYGAVAPNGRVIIFTSNTPRLVEGQGLWVEESRTNRLLHSRDLTQAAWAASNCTVTRNQPGADWDATANTGSLIAATANNGTVLQSVTLASSTVISSAFVRRVSGTGTVEMTQNGGANYIDITSQLNANGYVRVNTGAASVTNPQVGFRLGTSGDSIAVDFMQLEQASNVSNPTITTTTTRGRGNEMPMFGTVSTGYNDGQRFIDGSHFSRLPMSQYVEFSGLFDGTIANVKGGGNWPTGRIQINVSGNAELRTSGSGSSMATSNTVNSGLSNVNRIATRQNGIGGAICMNGGTIATSTDNKIDMWVNATDDHIGLGNRGNGDQAIRGYISRYTCFRRELTDGEMLELTR